MEALVSFLTRAPVAYPRHGLPIDKSAPLVFVGMFSVVYEFVSIVGGLLLGALVHTAHLVWRPGTAGRRRDELRPALREVALS
jgi:hypothetical protein